jgi:hypothetical protein
MVRTLLLSVVLLAACKKAAKPDCDGAGKAIEAAAVEAAANAKDELARETAKRVGPAAAANVVLRCKNDGWSAAATDCVKAAKGGTYNECESKLTKEQVANLKGAVPPIDPTPGLNAATPPAGPPADCAAVEAAMTNFWNGRVSAATSDADRKAAEETRAIARDRIGKHCRDDKWSAAASDCFKAVTNGDFASCESRLTPDQVGRLRGSAPAIDPNGAMNAAAAAAAGSAVAGSAAGSADGSAAAPAADGSAGSAPTP